MSTRTPLTAVMVAIILPCRALADDSTLMDVSPSVTDWRARYQTAEAELQRVLPLWADHTDDPTNDEEANLARQAREERVPIFRGLATLRLLDDARSQVASQREALVREWEVWRLAEGQVRADEQEAEERTKSAWEVFLDVSASGAADASVQRARRSGSTWWEGRNQVDWPEVFAHQDDVSDRWEASAARLSALAKTYLADARSAGPRSAKAAEEALRADGQVWFEDDGVQRPMSVYSARLSAYRHKILPPSAPDALATLETQLGELDERISTLKAEIRTHRRRLEAIEDELVSVRANSPVGASGATDVFSRLHSLDAEYTLLWDGLATTPVDADEVTLCDVLVHGALVRVLLGEVDAIDLINPAVSIRSNACQASVLDVPEFDQFQWAWSDALRRSSEDPTVPAAVFADGGRWSVDGTPVFGAGPVRLELKAGTHRVQVRTSTGRIYHAMEDLTPGESIGFFLTSGGIAARSVPGLADGRTAPIVVEDCPEPADVPRPAGQRLLRAGPWLSSGVGVGLTATGVGLLADSARIKGDALGELSGDRRADLARSANIQRAVGFASLGLGLPIGGVSVYVLLPRNDVESPGVVASLRW